jgi:serine/threonine-protein kinase
VTSIDLVQEPSGESAGEAADRGFASRLKPGSEFAGHRIEVEVGHGGMGVVYRARHLALDRVRALKVISPGLSEDPVYAERFRRECRLAASVEHPAVVTVHHAGEEDGLLYMSMQFIDGFDLGRMLADGPTEPRRATRLLAQLAAGLDAAHEGGLIHRDVKPENVLIAQNPDGEAAFLTDFGIGTIAEASDRAETKLTRRGIVLGTSDYIAPEQIAGDAIDSRADVYSLACVAFHMLTGQPPFADRSELGKLAAHGNESRPRASDRSPALGSGIDDTLARGMAVDPDDRPATAGALVTGLERGLQTGSEAETRPLPATRHPRGRWLIAAAFAAAGIALLVVLALSGSSDDAGEATTPIAAAATLDVPRDPVAVAAGGDRIWVGGRESDRVMALEADGTRPLGRGLRLENPRGLTLAFGQLWVVAEGRLVRIDLASGEINGELELDDPSDVAADRHHIWALDRSEQPRVVQVDPESLRVTGEGFVGDEPRSLASGAGSIWVTNTTDGTISEIDPDSARVIGNPTEVGGRPTNVAAGGGEVWVVDNFGGHLVRIDPDGAGGAPATAQTIDTRPRPRGIAIGLGSIWVSSGEDGTVARLDRDGGLRATYRVGANPADVDVGGGSVWTADQGSATVSRIDPSGG